MPVSMYDIAVPSFTRRLHALDGLLDKAVAYADSRKIDHETLLNARLYPDMFNFTRQIQACSDFAKAGSARLARVDIPSMPDTETSFSDLKARLAKTNDFLATLTPEQMDGSEAIEISIKVGPNMMSFSGQDYLLHFALPNFGFHAATAYGILRHNGVEIGKRDFMRRT